jgi:cytoplasmic iron level regulating protein YaaA (DUF328/UPF0246 family)
MPEKSDTLIEALKKYTPQRLQKLMEINDTLARLNVNRYHNYTWPHTPDTATAAMYTFRGEVYLGLNAQSMTTTEVEKADKSIRILSGLYGLLRPLDLIQPYRLEMGTELKVGKTNNLYSFWGDQITDLLQQDLDTTRSKIVVNLASQEYMAAINVQKLSVPVIDIQFLEDRNGKLQFLSYNAKRSRGWMARYVVDHKIKTIAGLKGFDLEGYSFQDSLSDSGKMVFVR